jgi:hypothetical protein
MPLPTTKTFDALEMSRQLREQTSRKLAVLTREERIALLNSHIRPTTTPRPIAKQDKAHA